VLREENLMSRLISIDAGEVELHGVAEVPSGARYLIMHHHGLAGNFYENPFIAEFLQQAGGNNYGFLTINSRAHDYLADAVVRNSGEVLARGAAHTSLMEIARDLASWYEYASRVYGLPIFMQGHSTGAVAVAYSILQNSSIQPLGTIYLSPTDMVGIQEASHGREGASRFLRIAEGLINDGRATELMPSDALEGYLLDAQVYSEMFSPDGPWDIFSFADPKKSVEAITKFPTCVIFGDTGEACPIDTTDALAALEASVGPAVSSLKTEVVSGAGHSYRGFETPLVRSIVDWCGHTMNGPRS
jgi:hypothetical protein